MSPDKGVNATTTSSKKVYRHSTMPEIGAFSNNLSKNPSISDQDSIGKNALNSQKDMRVMRRSMAITAKEFGSNSGSIRNSINRASVSFKLAGGTEAGDLVIENERLKSTLMILNQKLKVA